MTYESTSWEMTKQIGEELARSSKPGDIYCLSGDLGAGKTVFAQGFARGLGVDGNVTSPTFTIIHEYEGRLPLYHFDVYRLDDASEMDELGWEEYFFGEGVCLIEWGERISEIIPAGAVWIHLEKDEEKGWDYRRITTGEVACK